MFFHNFVLSVILSEQNTDYSVRESSDCVVSSFVSSAPVDVMH